VSDVAFDTEEATEAKGKTVWAPGRAGIGGSGHVRLPYRTSKGHARGDVDPGKNMAGL